MGGDDTPSNFIPSNTCFAIVIEKAKKLMFNKKMAQNWEISQTRLGGFSPNPLVIIKRNIMEFTTSTNLISPLRNANSLKVSSIDLNKTMSTNSGVPDKKQEISLISNLID